MMLHKKTFKINTRNPSVFFIGEFSQKFDLKNGDFKQHKGFFMEKWFKFAKFRKEKKFKLQNFYNKFQYVAKNIEGSWFFPTFISGM